MCHSLSAIVVVSFSRALQNLLIAIKTYTNFLVAIKNYGFS
jgi:hypothetical protein